MDGRSQGTADVAHHWRGAAQARERHLHPCRRNRRSGPIECLLLMTPNSRDRPKAELRGDASTARKWAVELGSNMRGALQDSHATEDQGAEMGSQAPIL